MLLERMRASQWRQQYSCAIIAQQAWWAVLGSKRARSVPAAAHCMRTDDLTCAPVMQQVIILCTQARDRVYLLPIPSEIYPAMSSMMTVEDHRLSGGVQ